MQPGQDQLLEEPEPERVRHEERQVVLARLEDLIERNLFPYIFAEDDREDDNFAGLLSTIERMLARERIEEGRVVLRMLGRTGSLELEQTVWKSVPPAFRRLVTGLRNEEKVVLTPSARQPMIIRMPCPAWAMNQEDVAFTPPVNGRLPRTERED